MRNLRVYLPKTAWAIGRLCVTMIKTRYFLQIAWLLVVDPGFARFCLMLNTGRSDLRLFPRKILQTCLGVKCIRPGEGSSSQSVKDVRQGISVRLDGLSAIPARNTPHYLRGKPYFFLFFPLLAAGCCVLCTSTRAPAQQQQQQQQQRCRGRHI